jgi:hypothetical protein
MRDFFFQIVVFLAGAVIGVVAQFMETSSQKKLAGILAVLLIAVSLVWAGYELGVRQPTPTVVAGVTPDTPTLTTEPQDAPMNTPTATATVTDTSTDTPTATATATDIPTNTPVPPTSMPTPTDIPTNTPVPPTSTPTPTDIPTNTPVPPTSTPTPTVATVSVSATEGWQSTGIAVGQGQHVQIVYQDGMWAGRAGHGPSYPDIWTDARGIDYEIFYPEIGITSRFGSLIGKVGNGPVLQIGSSYGFVSEQSGVLFLRMHDTGLDDNAGSINVAILVWP